MKETRALGQSMTRSRVLGTGAFGGLALLARPGWAQTMIDLPLPGGPGERSITTAFSNRAWRWRPEA
jgi:hypothetical protein